MIGYAEAFSTIVGLWRGEGGLAAATQYAEQAVGEACPKDKGRLMTALGSCYNRQERWGKAETTLKAALALCDDAEARAAALCELIDLCVLTHRVEDGMGYGFELDLLFRSGVAKMFQAPYHHNLGRLLLAANDHVAATPHLTKASSLFRESGRVEEAYMVDVNTAKALLSAGRVEEAEALVRRSLAATSPYVLMEGNLVLEQITAIQGDLVQAGRHIDRATRIHAETIEKRDYRMFLRILSAEADLAERSGEPVTARRIRALVERRAAAGRINYGEEVTV